MEREEGVTEAANWLAGGARARQEAALSPWVAELKVVQAGAAMV